MTDYEELDGLGRRRPRRGLRGRFKRSASRSIGKALSKVGQVISQPLYDTVIPVASQTEQTWFTTPRGGTANDTSTVKTSYHTNMTLSGQLPTPQSFEMIGVAWMVESTALVDGIQELMDGYTVLTIADKEYFTLPNNAIPIQGSWIPTAGQTTSASNFADGRPYFKMYKPITIKATHSFFGKTVWNNGLTAVGTNLNNLHLLLIGNLTRSVN